MKRTSLISGLAFAMVLVSTNIQSYSYSNSTSRIITNTNGYVNEVTSICKDGKCQTFTTTTGTTTPVVSTSTSTESQKKLETLLKQLSELLRQLQRSI